MSAKSMRHCLHWIPRNVVGSKPQRAWNYASRTCLRDYSSLRARKKKTLPRPAEEVESDEPWDESQCEEPSSRRKETGETNSPPELEPHPDPEIAGIRALLSANSNPVVPARTSYLRLSANACVIQREPLLVEMGLVDDQPSRFLDRQERGASIHFKWIVSGKTAWLNYFRKPKAEKAEKHIFEYLRANPACTIKKTPMLKHSYNQVHVWTIILKNLGPEVHKFDVLGMFPADLHPEDMLIRESQYKKSREDKEVTEDIQALLSEGPAPRYSQVQLMETKEDDPFVKEFRVTYESPEDAHGALEYLLRPPSPCMPEPFKRLWDERKESREMLLADFAVSALPSLHVFREYRCRYLVDHDLANLVSSYLIDTPAAHVGGSVQLTPMPHGSAHLTITSPYVMNLARLKCAVETLLDGHLIGAEAEAPLTHAAEDHPPRPEADDDMGGPRADPPVERALRLPWAGTSAGHAWLRSFAERHGLVAHVDDEHRITLYGPKRKDAAVLAELYRKLLGAVDGAVAAAVMQTLGRLEGA